MLFLLARVSNPNRNPCVIVIAIVMVFFIVILIVTAGLGWAAATAEGEYDITGLGYTVPRPEASRTTKLGGRPLNDYAHAQRL